MSQLFKSILARGYLAQRAFVCQTPNHKLKLHTKLLTVPISHSYVTDSNPPKFNKYQSKLAFDTDEFSQYPAQRYNSKQRFSKPSYQRKFREEEVRPEQHGIEDAEPVEFLNKPTDYSSNPSDVNGFDKYKLPEELISQMNKFGYTTPFEIQESTLPETLTGRDMVAKAFTGSGKTLAFAIPIITKILNSPNKNSPNPKCLILSPTRELCLQLQKCINQLAPYLNTIAVYGGSGYEGQIAQFRRRVDIICATPGRLRDFMQKDIIKIDSVDTVCLDEADELLTPNFKDQIIDVLELGNKKQMLMFSATINKSVFELIKLYMRDPAFVDLTKGQRFKMPTNIEHCIVNSYGKETSHIITHYLKEYNADKCIIFTKTKRQATELNYKLRRFCKSHDMHSDHSQFKREKILRAFRAGHLNVLIATDVAARGLDIHEVNLVIQVGFPANGIEYYIHRSGRCGRAGRLGTSILLDDGQTKIDRDLFRLIQFKRLALPDTIPDSEIDNFDRQPMFSSSNKKSRSFSESYSMDEFGMSPRKPYNKNYSRDRPPYNRNRDSYRRKSMSDFDDQRFDREEKWSTF